MSDPHASSAERGESFGSGWRAVVAAVPAVLLVAVAAWEMIASAGPDLAADDPDSWSQISQTLRKSHQPGDLIVFAPGWIDPLGRQHLGDLIPIDMAARMDSAGYSVIWEVSLSGARAKDTRELAPESVHHFGPLALSRYRQQPSQVLTDFVGLLSKAEVSGAVGARPKVSVTEVGFEPHRCIEVVPPPGKEVTLRFPGVRTGSRLVGYVGLADVFTRRDIRDPGRLRVLVAGEQVAEVIAGVDDGWVGFSVDTQARDSATVELVAAAIGPKARKRHLCFAVEARQ